MQDHCATLAGRRALSRCSSDSAASLGSGKTTWARALLRGLGYTGRVPSPTYTLLENYTVGPLPIVHFDLYRVASEDELGNLGLRDWLEKPRLELVEWPERAPKLAERCDLILDFRFIGPSARSVTFTAATQAGSRGSSQHIVTSILSRKANTLFCIVNS